MNFKVKSIFVIVTFSINIISFARPVMSYGGNEESSASASYLETELDYSIMCISYFNKPKDPNSAKQAEIKCGNPEFAECSYNKVLQNNGIVTSELITLIDQECTIDK